MKHQQQSSLGQYSTGPHQVDHIVAVVNESTSADIRASKTMGIGSIEGNLPPPVQITEESVDPTSVSELKGFEETNTWIESLPQIIFVVIISAVVVYFAYDYDYMIELFERFIDWVVKNPLQSSASIVLVYVGLIVFTFPVMYITIALGYAYAKAWEKKKSDFNSQLEQYHLNSSFVGFVGVFLMITFAVLSGAVIAFLLAKCWLGKTIKKRCLKNHRSFIAINSIVTQNGWRIVMLLRLTPLPFSIVSYFLGLTKVKIRDYLLGSSITCTYIALWLYIGQSLLRFTDINKKLKQQKQQQNMDPLDSSDAQFEFFFLGFEIIMAFAVGIFISYKAKIELDKRIEQSRVQDEERQSVIKNEAQ